MRLLNRHIIASLLAAAGVGAALALGFGLVVGAPDTALPWSVFGSGGGTNSSSASYNLGSTAGQTAIGPASSTGFQLGAGFWYGVDKDGDSIPDPPDNCPSDANTNQADGDSDLLGDVCDPCIANPDCDGDTWRDGIEVRFIGTDPLDNCADNAGDAAHPADFNNDKSFDMTDMGEVAGAFGQPVGPSPNPPARKDIAPDPPDGFVDITDIARVAGLFGQVCT